MVFEDMNQIPKRDRYAEEIARIREVVARHPLPEFVTGFDVRLGEFDGDPAMWVVFFTNGVSGLVGDRMVARSLALASLRHEVYTDLISEIEDRFPYFRFEHDSMSQSVQH